MTKNRLPLFFFDAVDQPIRFSSFGFPYRVTEWKKTRYTGWVPVASKEIHIGFLSPSDWRRWLAFYRIYRKSYEDVEIHFDVHGLLRFDVVYSSFPFRKASLEPLLKSDKAFIPLWKVDRELIGAEDNRPVPM